MSRSSQLTLAKGAPAVWRLHKRSSLLQSHCEPRRTARSKTTSKLKQEGDLKRTLSGTNNHKLWQLPVLSAWVTFPNKSTFTRGWWQAPKDQESLGYQTKTGIHEEITWSRNSGFTTNICYAVTADPTNLSQIYHFNLFSIISQGKQNSLNKLFLQATLKQMYRC